MRKLEYMWKGMQGKLFQDERFDACYGPGREARAECTSAAMPRATWVAGRHFTACANCSRADAGLVGCDAGMCHSAWGL